MPIRPKRHPRRKDIPGLTPADVVAQMTEVARGGRVRKVRGADKKPKDAVLSAVRQEGPDPAGEGGIPAAPDGNDAGRSAADKRQAVPDAAGVVTALSRILKRMLTEPAPAALMEIEGIGKVATNGEALAAVIQREALAGKQWAVELWRDQTEGKPVRGVQVNNTDEEVEDHLDQVSVAALNRIANKGNGK